VVVSVALPPEQIVTGGVMVAAIVPTVTVAVAEDGQLTVPVATVVTVYVVVTVGATTMEELLDPVLQV
jgi:hypothetical protein